MTVGVRGSGGGAAGAASTATAASSAARGGRGGSVLGRSSASGASSAARSRSPSQTSSMAAAAPHQRHVPAPPAATPTCAGEAAPHAWAARAPPAAGRESRRSILRGVGRGAMGTARVPPATYGDAPGSGVAVGSSRDFSSGTGTVLSSEGGGAGRRPARGGGTSIPRRHHRRRHHRRSRNRGRRLLPLHHLPANPLQLLPGQRVRPLRHALRLRREGILRVRAHRPRERARHPQAATSPPGCPSPPSPARGGRSRAPRRRSGSRSGNPGRHT
jgi:hypothetical protein